MRKQLGITLCVVFLFCATARAQNPSKEERAIRAVVARWQQEWNRHDAKALAGLLTVEADYVAGDGTWLHGRTQFENWYVHHLPATYLNGSWTNGHPMVRFLQPEVAVLHLTWTLQDGSGQRPAPDEVRANISGISTWLLVKLGDGWKIRAAQDTMGSP